MVAKAVSYAEADGEASSDDGEGSEHEGSDSDSEDEQSDDRQSDESDSAGRKRKAPRRAASTNKRRYVH